MFGTGYVGLVTGACFAEMGNDVICVDINPATVAGLEAGRVPIFEPGLEPMVQRNHAQGRLRFTTDAELGVNHADVCFIAVGTPPDEDGSADLRHVLQVARTIGAFMQHPKLIVGKSTVPVGTADKVRDAITQMLIQREVDIEFDVAANPEFLKEGAAVSDFMKPDRIVIGCSSQASAKVLEQIYAPFNRNHDRIVHMDTRSAELTKYAANVMLASRISLMNEFASLAEALGADIEQVRLGIGTDPRIGYHFIYAGAGYGGSCFPKDVKALIHTAEKTGVDPVIMRSIESVNERQKNVLMRKIRSHFGDDIIGRRFALWGLAFKPNTDDMREAPSLSIISGLLASGAKIRAYDPKAAKKAALLFKDQADVKICSNREATLEDADALIVVTEWNEFRSPDFARLARSLRGRVIFDGRNLYDPQYLESFGIAYYGIGRGR